MQNNAIIIIVSDNKCCLDLRSTTKDLKIILIISVWSLYI